MAMIEINIHIPIDGVNNISIPIQLPVVQRVGEKIYLSNKQVDNLISCLGHFFISGRDYKLFASTNVSLLPAPRRG